VYLKRPKRLAILGGSTALLAISLLATQGFSSWTSQVTSPTNDMSTVASIPTPVTPSTTANNSNGTYTISWSLPTETSYNGQPLIRDFLVQGLESSGWVTLATVSATTTSYTTPATSSITSYQVISQDYNWLSTPPAASPAPPVTVTTTTQQYNPPPDYCGTNQYYHCQINQVSGDVAGFWISIARPYPHVRNDIFPIASFDSLSNGAVEIPNVPESNINYYGVGSWTAFGDAFGSSASSTPTYVDSGSTMVSEPYWCNPYASNPYRYTCPYTGYTVFVASGVVFPGGVTYSPGFAVGNTLWNVPSGSSTDYGLPYEPSCSNYPSSASSPDYNSYVATCVTPYDSSYTEYSTVNTTETIN
jgi:hypothetical protein